MFGLPNLPTIIVWSVAPIFIAIAIVNYKETWYNIMGLVFVCINTWFAVSSYMAFMYDDWRRGSDNKPLPLLQPEVKKYLDLNTATATTYSQTTDVVKVNSVRQFNRTLIEQYQGKLEVNLTEGFWLNKLPGADESNWIKAGGVGRADFVDMLERGVRWGAYKKVGGQGKRTHNDWRKISQLAQGYPLPRWEQLPKV